MPPGSHGTDFNESILRPLQQKQRKPPRGKRAPKASYLPPYKPRSKIDLDESVLRPLKRHKEEDELMKACPESALASMNESVLGPLHRKNKGNPVRMEKNQSLQQARMDYNKSLDTTVFNESILGPLARGKAFGNTENNLLNCLVAADKDAIMKEKTARLGEVAATGHDFSSELESTLFCESIVGPIILLKGKDKKSQRDGGGNVVVGASVIDGGKLPSKENNASTFERMMKMLEGPHREKTTTGEGPLAESCSNGRQTEVVQSQSGTRVLCSSETSFVFVPIIKIQLFLCYVYSHNQTGL